MTSYPALLATSGHGAAGQSYESSDYYGNIGLGRCPMKLDPFTTESAVSRAIRVPGTISYLSWALDTAFDAGLTLSVNKNSSSTSLAVSVGGSTTGWVTDSSSAHAVSVSSGDVLDFDAKVSSPGNASYSGYFYCISARFDSDTGTGVLSTVGGPSASITPTTTQQFVKFVGVFGLDTSETDQNFYALTGGTWRSMACNIANNTFNGTTTFNSRKNFGDGYMAVSVSALESGYFEDGSVDDAVSEGDLLCYAFASSRNGNSGETFTLSWIGAHFLPSNAGQCMIGGSNPTTASLGAGTKYTSLFGGGETALTGTGGLPRATGLFPYALQASNFTNHISEAGPTGVATFTLLKNCTSALSITTSAGETGFITDAGPLSFDLGDTCANQITVTQGSITWASASLLLEAS